MGKEKTNFEINIPLSYNDITLSKYKELLNLYEETDNKPEITQIISVLSGIPNEELKTYPVEVMNVIMEKLSYLAEPLTSDSSNEIEIKGEKYIINRKEKLKFGEFVDAQTLLKNDKNNFAYLLAIICRKENEIYDDDFISNKIDDRIKMYSEQPITKVYPIINFMLLLSLTSKENIQEYSEHLVEAIDQLASSIQNSKASGIGKKFILSLQKKRCKILKKRAKHILRQH